MQRVGRTDSDLCQWPGILSGVGEKAQELFPGDVVNSPAGVKHWHGATPYSWFSHLAVEVPAEEGSNEWLEPVDEDAYMRALC